MTDPLAADPAPAPDPDLDGAARAYDVPAGDVGAVLHRAHRRATRRNRALAALSVMSLVATAAVGVDLLDGERPTTLSSGAPVVRGSVGMEWRVVTPASGLGFAASDAGSSLPLYAVSTAPGQAEVGAAAGRSDVVWRSDDGVEWTSVSVLDRDLFASDLSSRDDRVYAVGTGPATAAAGRPVSPLLVGWSDDGARTWERAALPIDLAAVASRTTRSAVRSTAVAAGPAGTVVVGVLDASLDVARSLPAGVSAPHGWAYSTTGVDLLGPDRGAVCPQPESAPAPAKEAGTDPTGEVQPAWCPAGDGSREGAVVSAQDARGVTASFTWEQLGVDGDLLRAVRRQLVAFAAPPGSDRFERLEVPDVAHVQGPVLLDASEDGFQVVATTAAGIAEPQLVVLASPDGRSWTAGEPLPAGWAAAAGRVGGVTTVVAQDGRGPVLVRADGAGGWATTPLDGLLEPPAGSRVGLGSAAVGPFGVVASVVVAPVDDRGGDLSAYVLVSRDGRGWEVVDVDELAGRPVRNVVRTAVAGDRVIVAVSVTPTSGGRPEQLVLVGTPS